MCVCVCVCMCACVACTGPGVSLGDAKLQGQDAHRNEMRPEILAFVSLLLCEWVSFCPMGRLYFKLVCVCVSV